MYWQSKRRHDCATSASEFLAPVALVQVSSLRFATVVIFTGGREREGVQAFTVPHHNPPLTANVAHSSLTPRPPRSVEQSSDSHLLRHF